MTMKLTHSAQSHSVTPWRRPISLVLTMLLLIVLPATGFAQEVDSTTLLPVDPSAKIVNGELTWNYPSVVDIVVQSFAGGNLTVCSGTLIGCQTVLTAAHCVCAGNTAGSCGTPDPEDYRIFGQNFGFADVNSITVNPSYSFGVAGDLAIMTLDQPVTGIGPSPINTTGKPAPNSAGRITGYGITDGNSLDSGLLRTGLVTTTTCSGIPNAGHVCWEFENPIGSPGQDSNTCSGDSGGPLFVNFGSGLVVAGVTSGGFSADCLPLDESFDADVFANRAWIQSVAGSDLNNTSCGSLASAGTAGSPILAGEGTLNGSNTQELFNFETTADVNTLRVTINGEDQEQNGQENDFDLYVKFGSPPVPPNDVDCSGILLGTNEECEFPNPAVGTWFILTERFEGAGDFQVAATLLGVDDGGGGGGGCTADTDTICLLDNRFKVEIAWRDFEGDTGVGRVVTTSDDSGLLYFFGPNNWEFLVKMVDACSSQFNSFWVFSAATTNVEYTLTITDTQTNTIKTYHNDLGTAAPAVTDTMAFSTCP